MKIVTARHENRDEIDRFGAVAVTEIVTSLSTIPYAQRRQRSAVTAEAEHD